MEWVSVNQWTPNRTRNNWYRVTLRQVMQAATIDATGTKIRFTFRAPSSRALRISDCFVGKCAGTNPAGAAFMTAPTRVTFGGADGFTLAADGLLVSDEIDFVYDSANGDALVVSWYVPYDGARLGSSVARSVFTGTTLHYIVGNHAGDMPSDYDGVFYFDENAAMSVVKTEILATDLVTKPFEFDYKVENNEATAAEVSKFSVYAVASLGAYAEVSKFATYSIVAPETRGELSKFGLYVVVNYSITTDLNFDYYIGDTAPVHVDCTFDYSVLSATTIFTDFDFDYGVGVVAKSFNFDYIVYGVINTDFVFDYNIAYVAPINVDYTFDYGVVGLVAANLEFDYEIYFEPPKPIFVDFKFDAGVDENEVPFVLIPETPVIEVWSYDTAKAVSYDGTEQRAALRSEPKTMLEYTYILDEADRTQVYRQMLNNIRGLFVVPLFANATETLEPMSAGNTTVYCDLTRTDIRVGNRVYYTTSRADVYGTAFVESVGNGFFTVVGGVSIDLPAGSWVMPMRETFITDGGSIAMASMSGESTFVFVSANRRKLVRPAAATGLVAEFDGLPLLDLRPLADNDVDEEFTANVRYITQASDVPPAAFSTWNMPVIEGEREYLARRPLDMDYWREFADKTVGQRSSFLVPSFRPDLTPVPGLSAGTNVRVHGEHYWSWGTVDSYSRLRFETSAGVYNRKVSSVSRIGGNTAIVLDTALPAADILRISYLNRVRLATNDIRLEHHDTQSLVTIGIRTVNE